MNQLETYLIRVAVGVLFVLLAAAIYAVFVKGNRNVIVPLARDLAMIGCCFVGLYFIGFAILSLFRVF